MKNTKYSKYLDSLVERDIPNNLDLAPDILRRIQKSKGVIMNKRTKVLIPSTLVVVFMALVILTVPAVADTLQKWIGYIPGFGRVQDNNIRVLVEPLTQTINGVTINIDEVVASSDKTLVKYSLTGIALPFETQFITCPDSLEASMSLPNGKTVKMVTAGSEGNYQFTAEFTSIPNDIDQVVFGREIQLSTEDGCSPLVFSLPLILNVNSQVELTAIPFIDLPTQTPEELTETNGNNSSSIGSMSASQAIPLQDGYILLGSIKINSVDNLSSFVLNGYIEDINVLDANNKTLGTEIVPNDFLVETENLDNDIINWAFLINSVDIAWPITITVNSVPMVTERYPNATFLVDVGNNPEPGQKWDINKDVQIGPKTIHVVSIERKQTDFGNGYEITCISDPSFMGSVNVVGDNRFGGGGGGGGGVGGETLTYWSGFMGEVPTGILTLELKGQGVETIKGPWQVVVDKPNN